LRIGLIVIAIVLVVLTYVKRESLLKAYAGPGSSTGASEPARAELKVLYWQDPMHPSYKSDKPGKAPDCGMDLVPVYENGPGSSSNLPAGAFRISPEKQQLIGVTFGTVAFSPVSKTLRTVARLAYDETKIVRIHTKIEGWIEDVYVDFTGKEFRKGQPLISIYSPELLQTQQEYLLALKGRAELSESPFGEAAAGSESLLQSARRRLELWDISDAQIKDLEARGKPTKNLTLYAPSNGFVLARSAYPKQRVTPDVELYQIADLSTIWALADIYEYEAPEIKLGQKATMTLSYYPGRTFRGQISYIYPQLDNTTRTLRVRIEFPNPDVVLKPDMYANVDLKIDYGNRLVVPQEAVLDSGSDQTVFVAHEDGYFEPRKVRLGPRVDNQFIVLAGLKQGERIATSANFLIDSESNLKSAAAAMGMPGMSHGTANGDAQPSADHVGNPQPAQQPDRSTRPQPENHSKHNSGDRSQPRVADAPGADHLKHQVTPQRKVLYWYDPMHPDYRSDKAGKAPDCGMDLVPKYADEK
jgi:RND family efflux transporter MFP subunit